MVNKTPQWRIDLIRDLAASGETTRAICEIAGVAKTTAGKYKNAAAVERCPCGRPINHRGWCSVRNGRSKNRQAFMAAWRNSKLETCPRCGGWNVRKLRTRDQYDCKSCEYQFTPSSGTIFSSPKMPRHIYIDIVSALEAGEKPYPLSKRLGINHRTVWAIKEKLVAHWRASSDTDHCFFGEAA